MDHAHLSVDRGTDREAGYRSTSHLRIKDDNAMCDSSFIAP